MSYFTEKLVQEIQARSCIWDTTDANHLNKEVLSDTWTDIAKDVYPEWHTLGSVERRDRVADLKKKWTNIKDSFVKDVKGKKHRKSQQPQHAPPEPRKKYYLFDHLQFLLPFIQDAKSAREDGGPAEERPKKKHRNSDGGRPLRQDAPRTSRPPPPPPPHTAAGNSARTADVQRHVDAFDRSAVAGAALCQLDDDLSFLVSLMPSVKSMDEMQKINFKIGALQLVAKIKFDEALRQRPADGCGAGFPAAAYRPFPFVDHAAVSSTRRRKRSRGGLTLNQEALRAFLHVDESPPTVKEETVDGASPGTSYYDDTDRDEDDDDSDNGGGGGGGGETGGCSA